MWCSERTHECSEVKVVLHASYGSSWPCDTSKSVSSCRSPSRPRSIIRMWTRKDRCVCPSLQRKIGNLLPRQSKVCVCVCACLYIQSHTHTHVRTLVSVVKFGEEEEFVSYQRVWQHSIYCKIWYNSHALVLIHVTLHICTSCAWYIVYKGI